MGIFDRFKQMRQNKADAQYDKYGDTLKNMVTTKEQRMEAIEALAKAPAESSVPQLLKRFDLIVDHGIQDTREKEMVCDAIIKNKDVSKPFVREAVNRSRRISWPIKLAERIFEKDDFLNLLLENVSHESVAFDDFALERATELVLALREMSDARIVERVKPLLQSRSEQIRMAALDCLEAQGESFEDARKAIVALLQETATDDNSRFLGLVRNICQRKNWS